MKNNYSFLWGRIVWSLVLLIALVVSIPFVLLSVIVDPLSVTR